MTTTGVSSSLSSSLMSSTGNASDSRPVRVTRARRTPRTRHLTGDDSVSLKRKREEESLSTAVLASSISENTDVESVTPGDKGNFDLRVALRRNVNTELGSRQKKQRLAYGSPLTSSDGESRKDEEEEPEDDLLEEDDEDDDEDDRTDGDDGSDFVFRIERIFACRFTNSMEPGVGNESASQVTPQEGTSSSHPIELQSSESTDGRQVSTSTTSSVQEMEYYVKLEGESYRKLKWMRKSELSSRKNDHGDQKIIHFHRKFTGGATDVECPLKSEDKGNFFLYCQVDRIVSVRDTKEDADDTSDIHMSNTSQTFKEYLVKWRLLGYSEATWEPVHQLTNIDDRQAIQRFYDINTSFEYPVCAPSPSTTMAADLSKASKNLSLRKNGESNFKSANGLIEGERYQSETLGNLEGMTRLWQMFMKRKLAIDGTYTPSIRRETVEEINELGIKETKIKTVSSRSLMAHQQEGLKWLFFNSEVNRHGSLLADEMGLGKTCQSIAFLEHFLDVMSAGRNLGCHALVVVQKSVFENWRREFELWAPNLNVLPFYGGREDRAIAKEYEHKWICPETGKPVSPPSNLPSRKLMKPDVVLVTYEGLRAPEFIKLTQGLGVRNFKWTCVVVDECQKVKAGKTSLLLQLLSALKREVTILLTGTPIQNTTEELFPMLTLIHPSKFSYEETKDNKSNSSNWSATKFNNKFGNIQDKEDCLQLTEDLHKVMAPYILRREKTHVLKTLPPKTVKLVKIPLTLIQKRVYSALYHKSIKTKGLKFSNIHMQLRKCCIHPFLIEGIEDLIFDGKINGNTEKGTPLVQREFSSEEKSKFLLLESSGKFVLLKKMLESYHAQNRKVLIFSFFKTALDLIEDFIHLYEFQWILERVDGQTSGADRQLAIDRFNSDPSRFLFLCTTRAGGLGINLTAASVVIHLDSDFNPQHDLQAQARCHRIGQDKPVDVFHFIAEHTYEDHMLFTIAGKKLGLEAVLLGRLDSTKGRTKLDKFQEERVLRKGVFAAVRDDEAAIRDATEFAQSSIEDILSTKSTTVLVQQSEAPLDTQPMADEILISTEPEETSQKSGPPKFSTATFTTNEAGGSGRLNEPDELDEDKPNFWVKVAQRLGPWSLEEEKPQELTRADRRRGRTVSYRNSFYDEDYGDLRSISFPRSTAPLAPSSSQFEDDEEAFSPESCEDSSAEDSDEDATEAPISLDDLEVGGAVLVPGTKKIIPEPKKFPRSQDRVPNSSSSVPSNQPLLTQVPRPVSPAIQTGTSAPDYNQMNSHVMNTPGLGGSLVAMEFLYRCLRALKAWRKTRVGETGALRTDDIRDADRRAPWAIETPNSAKATASAADQLLRQSWLETLELAGIDWEIKRSAAMDNWAKAALQEKRDLLESQWLQHLRSVKLPVVKSKEQLVQHMNSFFVAEARRLAVATYGDQIVTELQVLCDEAAAEILTGRHESPTPPSKPMMMRWPPPQLEINWSITTEVIKRLNRYTGGPERRKAAINERFYNKLDSRWNHDEFTCEEREVLAVATANGLAAHNVAEELGGRSLERIKKGMRCPAVQRKAHKESLLLQRTHDDCGVPYSMTGAVDIISKFRAICREKNIPSAEDDNPQVYQTPKTPPQFISSSTPVASNSGSSSQAYACSNRSCITEQDVTEHQNNEAEARKQTLVQHIKSILTQMGVESEDFEKLRASLMALPAASLVTLVKQLLMIRQKEASASRFNGGIPPQAPIPSTAESQ